MVSNFLNTLCSLLVFLTIVNFSQITITEIKCSPYIQWQFWEEYFPLDLKI